MERLLSVQKADDFSTTRDQKETAQAPQNSTEKGIEKFCHGPDTLSPILNWGQTTRSGPLGRRARVLAMHQDGSPLLLPRRLRKATRRDADTSTTTPSRRLPRRLRHGATGRAPRGSPPPRPRHRIRVGSLRAPAGFVSG